MARGNWQNRPKSGGQEDAEQTPFYTLEKITDMILYANPILAQYPKTEKYVMVADIRHMMYEELKICVRVKKKKSRKTELFNLDVENETLKRFIRLSYNLRYLNMQHYETWSGKVAEIGKMIGGMIAAEDQKPQKS